MQSPWTAVTYLGAVLGVLCASIGFMAQGLEGAVLLTIVGYFSGKAIQSVVWTITGYSAM